MIITDIIYNELNNHVGKPILIKNPKEEEEYDGNRYVSKDVVGTLCNVHIYTGLDGIILVMVKVKKQNQQIEREYDITHTNFEFIS